MAVFPTGLPQRSDIPNAGPVLFQTTLASALGSGETSSLGLLDGSGLPSSNGFVIVDYDDENKIEIVVYASRSGNTLSTLTRGVGGTTQQAHDGGAKVITGPTGWLIDAIADETIAIAAGVGKKPLTLDTVDPTANDDDSAGYQAGSRWVNTTSGEAFVCVDPSTGAAVWTKTTTQGISDHGALSGLGDDDHTLYALADGSRVWALGNVYGCECSLNATDPAQDLDHAAGRVLNAAETAYLAVPALTKQGDAPWAEGDAAGGNAVASSLSADTWYYRWAISNDTTGAIDIMYDTSSTGANVPTGWTAERILGLWLTDPSGDWLEMFQSGSGSRRWYAVPRTSVLSNGSAASFTDVDLSSAVSPLGVRVHLAWNADGVNSSTDTILSRVRPDGSSDSQAIYLGAYPVYPEGSHWSFLGYLECECPGQIIEYRVNSGTYDRLYLDVVGYEEVL